jgi:hypothetical protein
MHEGLGRLALNFIQLTQFSVYTGAELQGFSRFDDVIVPAQRKAQELTFNVLANGKKQDWGDPEILIGPDFIKNLEPGTVAQHDIQEEDVKMPVSQVITGFRRRRGDDEVIKARQAFLNDQLVGFLILNDKNHWP